MMLTSDQELTSLAGLPPEFGASAALAYDAACLIPLAYHEAGHAVVAINLGVRVFHATLQPKLKPACDGHVLHQAADTIELDKLLLLALAGPAAESCSPLPCHDEVAQRATDDVALARRIVATLERAESGSEAVAASLARWQSRAVVAVRDEWQWISRIAIALTQYRRLSGDEIAALRPR